MIYLAQRDTAIDLSRKEIEDSLAQLSHFLLICTELQFMSTSNSNHINSFITIITPDEFSFHRVEIHKFAQVVVTE